MVEGHVLAGLQVSFFLAAQCFFWLLGYTPFDVFLGGHLGWSNAIWKKEVWK